MKENFPIKVKKKSGKPFKSGKKINTAIGIVINEDDPKERKGYIFEEDNSEVISIKWIPTNELDNYNFAWSQRRTIKRILTNSGLGF